MEKLKKLFIINLFVLLFLSSCAGKSENAVKLYLAAVDEYTKQEFDNSLKYIDMALKQDSSFYQAKFLKSKIFFMKGDYDKSKKIALKLVRRYPAYTEARLWYIRTLIYNDELEKASEVLEKELSFNVTDWRVFYLYSVLEGKKGNVDNQLVMLNRAEIVLKDSKKVYDGLSDFWEMLELEDKALDYKVKSSVITKSIEDLKKEE